MASVPDISAVVISWNTRELLARCLGSIARERERAGLTVETIVVDNASSDGSAAMIEERFRDARLIVLPENRGFAAANNVALASARGPAVLLLNPDAELAAGALDALWRALHAAPHVGLVGPLLLNSDGSVQSAGHAFPGLAQVLIDLFPLHPRLVASRLNGRVTRYDGLSPMAIDHPLGACMLVRRAVVDNVGGLDEGYFMYSEEIDWCRRIRAAGWTILLAPAARVVHHGGQSSGQAPEAMFLALHRSRARYLRRYEPAWVLPVASRAAGLAAWAAGCRGRPERARALEAVSRLYRVAADD
ncbi:MAG TPA: glycosyltransferase family 2 protein [Thermomicrobiaceae bacterium]|nr:glycosyltransferase family 2 protein [Thermomicrobiaceae bacterium]